jgi:urea transport system substrate-binding protein
MAIDEMAKGGVMGSWSRSLWIRRPTALSSLKEKCKQLGQDKVSVIFGCWTSVSRKSVLPVVEETNGLLFYPCGTRVKS